MKLRLAIAALIFAVAIALPYHLVLVQWQYDPSTYPKVVRWAGCHAELVVMPEKSPISSYYIPTEHTLVIGTQPDDSIPYYAGLFILFHETSHCLQHESGWLETQTDIVTVELNADRGASDLACGLGLDGRRISDDTFDWAHDKYGYNGDPAHGSLAQRKAQAYAAESCMNRSGQ